MDGDVHRESGGDVKTVSTYFRERFPLPAVALLSIGFALLLAGANRPLADVGRFTSVTALIALAFVGFILRQRVTDEFKDARHDDTNYPDRPVQRGLITRSTLVAIGTVAFTIEIAAVIAIARVADSWASIAWYGTVIGYSILTGVEFGVSGWLERHFTTYFVSHQVIFVSFAAWAFAIFQTPVTASFVSTASAVVLFMAAIEIVRKFEIRRDSRGVVVADTYPAVWGRTASLWVLAILLAVSHALFSGGGGTVLPLLLGVIALVALAVRAKSDRAVRAIVVVDFIALGTVVWST